MAKTLQVAIDCADPAALSEFWAAAVGYVLQSPPDGFASWPEALAAWGVPESEWNSASALIDPDGAGPRLFFHRVPESKSVKNRLHLDVQTSAGPSASADERRAVIEPEAERLVALGAERVEGIEEMGGYFVVMRDPEGNEFCVT